MGFVEMEFGKDLVDVRGLGQFAGLLLSISFYFEVCVRLWWFLEVQFWKYICGYCEGS